MHAYTTGFSIHLYTTPLHEPRTRCRLVAGSPIGQVLLQQAGCDATASFEEQEHSPAAREQREAFLVGDIVPGGHRPVMRAKLLRISGREVASW